MSLPRAIFHSYHNDNPRFTTCSRAGRRRTAGAYFLLLFGSLDLNLSEDIFKTAPLFLQVDLRHIDEDLGRPEVEIGVDLTEFYMSVEWDILEVPAIRNVKYVKHLLIDDIRTS